jgi:hypothetical protein
MAAIISHILRHSSYDRSNYVIAAQEDSIARPGGGRATWSSPRSLWSTTGRCKKADGALGKAFTTELIKPVVVKNAQKMCVSLVHSAEDVAKALHACDDVLKALPRKGARA